MEEVNEKLKDYDFGEVTKYIQSHEKKYPNLNYSLELSDVKFSDDENEEEKLYWVLTSNDEKYVFPEWDSVKDFLETSTHLLEVSEKTVSERSLTDHEISGTIAE